jgi:hypothetical protein
MHYVYITQVYISVKIFIPLTHGLTEADETFSTTVTFACKPQNVNYTYNVPSPHFPTQTDRQADRQTDKTD